MDPHIVMLCSLDTKWREAEYLRDRIVEFGATAILIDVGYGGPAPIAATIDADQVAAAAGSDLASVHALEDTGQASTLMMQGAIIKVQQLFDEGRCDGIVAFGGTSNTTLATGVMRTLPVGVPKVMISSAAAMPAYAAKFFGTADITMMNAPVDFVGLNDLTRAFLQLGAAAVHGMAVRGSGPVAPTGERPVAVTGFRFSETCTQAVIAGLEGLGYSVIPFHAQGVGENALEDLVVTGLFRGVVDVVPAGLSEHMLGGNRAARPDRLEAAGRVGIPQVIAPSGFDMISCGPISRKDSGDPLWDKRNLAQRKYSVPDRFRVEARTTADEVAAIARLVAENLNKADNPVCVMVPVRGWSSLSGPGADLHDPHADAVFVPTLRELLRQDAEVVEIDAELNSESFAATLVEKLHGYLGPKAP